MSRPEYVWKFNINRRVYRPGSMGPPIWREHWGRHKIVGENRVSYLLEYGGKVRKVADERTHVFDEAQLGELVWKNEHAHRISRAVQYADAATLRKIAALIDYV